MKKCTVCNQTYSDETLNFCLSDGGTLITVQDEAPPPTVYMNQAPPTNPTNWADNSPFSQPPPFNPAQSPVSPWQNSSVAPNSPYGAVAGSAFQVQNSTLPLISLVLGIFGILLFFCCYAGVPFGIGALITGFIGFNNTNKDPQQYGGRGLAIAGMALGALSVIGFLLVILLAGLGNLR
jgi:hypothetical protein